MKVSVALCTYNGERWLEPFLASLAGQIRPPDELVVSDDGSEDGTLAMIEAYAQTVGFPVSVSITPERLGSTFNFERAFAQCEGDLIAPADQDDVWAPSKLERLRAVMVADDASMVFSDGLVIDAAGAPVDTTLWEGVGFDAREQRTFRRDPLSLLVRRSVVTGAAMMFRADERDRLLPFPPSLNASDTLMLQDRWIALVLAAVGSVCSLPEPLISFRQHADQQTGLRQPVTAGEVNRQLRRPTSVGASSLSSRAEQLEEVLGRLGGDAHPGAEQVLNEAIGHLRARAALAGSRPRRIPVISRQWLSGRYWRYSGGTRSAVADLVRPQW